MRKLLHLEAVSRTVRVWWRRSRTRSALRALEAHLLHDVGLTRDDQRTECAKWFWR